MGKPPTKTSNADRLREQREARYGHLQATAEPAKLIEQAKSLDYGKSATAAMIGEAAVKLERKQAKRAKPKKGKKQ